MAQQQFSEIEEYLRLLKERREQARRNIFCGVCGKQHPKAVMKDKPTHAARWCGSCRVYHPANEGDVWLESKFLGTKYHIYARIDNVVVDITEWGESSMSHRTSLLLSPPAPLIHTITLSHLRTLPPPFPPVMLTTARNVSPASTSSKGTCQGLDTLEAGSHNVWITLKDSTTGSSASNASKGGKKNGGGRRGKGDLPRMEDMPDDMSVDQFMQMLMRSAARREAKAKQPPQPPQQKKKGGKGKKKKK